MAYAKSAVSSQQIIDAAIRVLARQGYARTSLLDIAKEAGMSKGALHYHYSTKEALIHAVLETACNVVQTRTMQAWSPSDNPFEALRKSLEELWATRAERTNEALVVADLLALSLYDESFRPLFLAADCCMIVRWPSVYPFCLDSSLALIVKLLAYLHVRINMSEK